MSEYIHKSTAIQKLIEIREGFNRAGRRVCVHAVDDCIEAIKSAYTKTVDEIQHTNSEPALKIVSVEAFFPKSVIGREVCRCEKCKKRIDVKDAYCRSCGSRLIDKRA